MVVLQAKICNREEGGDSDGTSQASSHVDSAKFSGHRVDGDGVRHRQGSWFRGSGISWGTHQVSREGLVYR